MRQVQGTWKEKVYVIFLIAIFFYMYFIGAEKGDVTNFSSTFAMFNVTFSVGLAALLIASIHLVQKSQVKGVKQDLIKFLRDFIRFILMNFFLMVSTFSGDYILMHIFLMLSLASTFIIIYTSKKFVEIFIEKIIPTGN
ncbi:hypothetical protein [Halobacillus salinus]|uniref:hypothetical protein n=1 Tax=Halobacillus salinus TaxID=192814 RepID=UPI0009A6D62A|nr:hypothetical protein [Halobacillus salinus]